MILLRPAPKRKAPKSALPPWTHTASRFLPRHEGDIVLSVWYHRRRRWRLICRSFSGALELEVWRFVSREVVVYAVPSYSQAMAFHHGAGRHWRVAGRYAFRPR